MMGKGLSQKDAANMVDMLLKQEKQIFIQKEVIERLVETLENIERVTPKNGSVNEWCRIEIAYVKEKLR